VIKFFSDLRQIGGFSGPSVSSSNKADRHNIAEILLKVALNTIKQTTKTIYSPPCVLYMQPVTQIPSIPF
jgi:hypothetical protein